MKHLYWLDDVAWARIEPHLPTGRRGARRVDDRRVISGIIHMLRTGRVGGTARLRMDPTRPSTTASIAGAGRACGMRCSGR